MFRPDPKRPAVVSIYEDRTLRRGDAVMTFAGLRVFAGSRTFPYRPEDFSSLRASRDIKGQLRRALIELDQTPFCAADRADCAADRAHYAADRAHYAADRAHYAADRAHYAADRAHYAADRGPKWTGHDDSSRRGR